MPSNTPKTVELGALITAAYGLAARLSASPEEIARLASGAVLRTLRQPRYRSLEVRGPEIAVMGLLATPASNDWE